MRDDPRLVLPSPAPLFLGFDAAEATPFADGDVILRHLKSRNGECLDLRLTFDKPLQRFTPLDAINTAPKGERPGKLQSAIAELWAKTPIGREDVDDWGAN